MADRRGEPRFKRRDSGSDEPRFKRRDSGSGESRFKRRDSGSGESRFKRRDSGSSSGRFQRRDSSERFQRRDRTSRDRTTVNCDACKKQCEVPFKPTSNKPIYCDNCFKKDSSPKGTDYSKQFEEINRKLDKILKLMN